MIGRALLAAGLMLAGAWAPALAQPAPAAVHPSPAPLVMPSPLPTPSPNASPLPYPAYGTPAPDVAALRAKTGVPAVVNLNQAEKIAVALSPTFAAQNAQWAAIHAKFTSEQQAIFPGVSANLSITRTQSPTQTSTITDSSGKPVTINGGGVSTQESGQIGLTQLIFDGGRVVAAIRSAKESDVAGKGTLIRNLQTLQFNVAKAYFGVLQDNAAVTADAQLVREFETNENAVRAQIRNGAAARSDLAGAQFQTAQARGNLISAQGSAIGAQAIFATTLGLDADTKVVPQEIGQQAATANPTYAVALKRALLLRPDYLAARYTVYSGEDALRYAKLARFPVLTGSAGYGDSRTLSEFGGSSSRSSVNVNSYTPANSLGLQLQIPIYDQGQTNYNVAVAASQLDQAKAALIQTKLQVESDVRSALADLISARASFVQAQAERQAAQVSLDATQAQYRVGANTILGLVTAEANLSTAASNYIAALYSVHTAEQNYLYATGASDLQL